MLTLQPVKNTSVPTCEAQGKKFVPGGPCGPGSPFGPGAPISPFGPGSPLSPLGPTAPNCARSSRVSFCLHAPRTTTTPDFLMQRIAPRPGAAHVRQSDASPIAQRVRFMVRVPPRAGRLIQAHARRQGEKRPASPVGHAALTGCSLHRSSHSCPHRQRRWKWSPRTSAQSRSKWTRISYRAPHRGQPRVFEKGGTVAASLVRSSDTW